MAVKRAENATTRVSIDDISSAIADGLGRAIERNGAIFRDRILIYGGRIDFNIRAVPERAIETLKEVTRLG